MYLIGIDSGGTHMVAEAYEERKRLVQENGGPGNIALDPAGTQRNIMAVLAQVFNQLPVAQCGGILIGIAGVATAGGQGQIIAAVHRQYAVPAAVVSDADLALLNGLHGGPGVIAIAGTGSIVLAQTLTGDRVRVGGWGWRFGDEGSAYDIVRRAFTVMAAARDDGQVSPIEPVLAAATQTTQYRAAVARSYQLDRGAFAGLARAVADAAQTGNTAAQACVTAAAEALAAQIHQALRRAGLPSASIVALAGSVAAKNDLFFSVMRRQLPDAELRRLQGSNAGGVQYYRFS